MLLWELYRQFTARRFFLLSALYLGGVLLYTTLALAAYYQGFSFQTGFDFLLGIHRIFLGGFFLAYIIIEAVSAFGPDYRCAMLRTMLFEGASRKRILLAKILVFAIKILILTGMSILLASSAARALGINRSPLEDTLLTAPQVIQRISLLSLHAALNALLFSLLGMGSAVVLKGRFLESLLVSGVLWGGLAVLKEKIPPLAQLYTFSAELAETGHLPLDFTATLAAAFLLKVFLGGIFIVILSRLFQKADILSRNE